MWGLHGAQHGQECGPAQGRKCTQDLFFAPEFSLAFMHLVCDPRQPFFQGGLEAPKGWTAWSSTVPMGCSVDQCECHRVKQTNTHTRHRKTRVTPTAPDVRPRTRSEKRGGGSRRGRGAGWSRPTWPAVQVMTTVRGHNHSHPRCHGPTAGEQWAKGTKGRGLERPEPWWVLPAPLPAPLT